MIKIIIKGYLGHFNLGAFNPICTLNFMFFQESYTIEESLDRIQNILFPEIQNQIGLLQFRIQESQHTESYSYTMLMAVSRFQIEFEGLKRLFKWVLIPAVTRCLTNEQCMSPFNGFTVLRSLNEKQLKALEELKLHCDSFVLNEEWSEDKKGYCLTTFRLLNAFLEYFNFTESTLIPLLKQLHDLAIITYEQQNSN
jgi:hypothetical protein